jgi:hypothetical protein
MMAENAPSSVKPWVVKVSLEGILVKTWLKWEQAEGGQGRWVITENLNEAHLFVKPETAAEELLQYMIQRDRTGVVLGAEIKFRGLSYPNPGG